MECGFKAFAETMTLMPKKPLSGSFYVVVIGLSLTFCRRIFFNCIQSTWKDRTDYR